MDAHQRNAETLARHRRILAMMLVKVTAYYLLLAGGVAIAIYMLPGFASQLPLGGVGEIADYGSSSIYDLEDALLSADDEQIEDIVTENTRARLARGPAWLLEATSLIYAMTATLLLMLPVSWVYKAIHVDSVYDHSIDTTTLVLPAVVAGIVTVVQHSLALAFSLAGIVASIGVGIAAGVKSLEIAVVLTVFFNYASIAVCAFGDGLESQHVVRRKAERKARKAAKAEAEKQAGGMT